MADRYIDYMECVEYGQYLTRKAQTLVGASELVDMEKLMAQVDTAVAGVQRELRKAGVKRSGLRSGRVDIEGTVTRARTARERFFHYLRSLPEGTRFDFDAFFPRRVLGDASRLKPDDLRGKLDELLVGFAATANARLPRAAEWKQELAVIRNELDAALAGKVGASTETVEATAELIQARKHFLDVYNGMAKRAVRIVLLELGRSQEYRSFFRDLQVNESRSSGSADEDSGDEPGDDMPDDAMPARPQAIA